MTKKFTDWMNEAKRGQDERSYSPLPRLKLRDGHSLSIQASKYHYCTPRFDQDFYEEYTSFEIGFPTFRSNLFIPFAEERERPTDTVYSCVPKEIIDRVINRHGGVVGFEQ